MPANLIDCDKLLGFRLCCSLPDHTFPVQNEASEVIGVKQGSKGIIILPPSGEGGPLDRTFPFDGLRSENPSGSNQAADAESAIRSGSLGNFESTSV